MTNLELNKFFDQIAMLCIGCGEPMDFLGEWPVQYHPEGKLKNTNQALRWICRTCRLPDPHFSKGYCIGAAMILSPEFSQLRNEDASSSDLSSASPSTAGSANSRPQVLNDGCGTDAERG